MTFRTLIRRSLRYHWRSHLGVVLGAAIGSAALIGALVVGDSVRESLREQALVRLGQVQLALNAGDRLFLSALADALQNSISDRDSRSIPVTAALIIGGAASTANGSTRVNQMWIIGVDPEFWKLAEQAPTVTTLPPGHILLNQSLANALGATNGDSIIVRVPKLYGLSGDFAVSQKSDAAVALRFTVQAVIGDREFGNFNLQASPSAPHNAFVPLKELQSKLGLAEQANLILAGGNQPKEESSRYTSYLRVTAQSELTALWTLIDAQMHLGMAINPSWLELKTPRVFLDPPVTRAALTIDTNTQPILTYLATLLQAGTNAAPYSMVTAAGGPWTPPDMRDDEILVSQWLADDLNVRPGDEVAMSYFLPESGAQLQEATNTFRVRAIVPMEMPWADRTLMPDFPGIEKAESTSDWDAGFPLTYKVRPKDDDYWKQHRGTPKAFITLAAGQKMWGNRFGNLTAIRFPIPTNAPLTPALSPGERENRSPAVGRRKADDTSVVSELSRDGQSLSPLPGGEGQGEGERKTQTAESFRAELEKKILANLKPEELGLRFEPVREQALKAAEGSQDFGGLFLGFSFFVILAALLLMAMLFQFGLEQRAPEIGTLLALGFTPKHVRRLLLREGVALAFVGGIIGTLGGLSYAKAMIHGLTTIWRDAVGASALNFHFTAQTLFIGLIASVAVSAVTIWLALRKFVKRPARELLVGDIGGEQSKVRSLKSTVVGAGALLVALGLVGYAMATGDTSNAGIFFGAGALVLMSGLSFASAWLGMLGGAPNSGSARPAQPAQRADQEIGATITFGSLALRGCARRRKRSLATVAMLACGSFLIVSIGVFRQDANRDAWKRSSGTGGFAFIGETTMPVVQDLNAQSGRDFFALSDRDLQGVSFVPFRVREGDEASCLNLNVAQKPRLLGVKPELLTERLAFSFSRLMEGTFTKVHPWSLLSKTSIPDRAPVEQDEIPAIGDANSIQWAMKKKVGDTIDYVDERGQPFKVRIVGAVANSILQGQLIIDETEFVKRFPGESGYRMFLIDAPSNTVSQVSATLSRAMQDVGLELTPAAQRLDQFNAVQNTYLGTFQVLGGLGLLLGSVGLGIVVLRNVLERRGELALLMAVGFRKRQVQRLLLMENTALLAAGLALGVVAAAVAVMPALLSPGAQLPVASLALTLGAVLINGAAWTWAATRLALRGDLLAALRSE